MYTEKAFHYFLTMERKRSERSNQPFLLVQVDFKRQHGMSECIDTAVAARLFSGLLLGVRETDFVGWYRAGRMAAAVLTQHSQMPVTNISSPILARLIDVIHPTVPPHLAGRLQVRISRLPPTVPDRS